MELYNLSVFPSGVLAFNYTAMIDSSCNEILPISTFNISDATLLHQVPCYISVVSYHLRFLVPMDG